MGGRAVSDFYKSWGSFKGKRLPKQINMQIIPIGCMRDAYKDGFDYWIDERDVLQVRIAEFENPDFAWFWAIHEVLEALRCIKAGIPLEAIEAFDAEHTDHEDPGSIPEAPYHKQHMQSMTVQHILCEQDGYSYEEYMDAEPIPLPKKENQP